MFIRQIYDDSYFQEAASLN